MVAMLTALSNDGATVQESVELMELNSGERREVDVVAVGQVAGHQTIVCIECRDWKRPQDVTWVEQAHAKFAELGANVKVLVSSSGFTQKALDKAVRFGIKTITPGLADPEEFVGQIVNRAANARFWYWVTLVKKAEVVITRNGFAQQQELPGNVPTHLADGTQVGILADLAHHVERHHTRSHHDEWEEARRVGDEKFGGRVKYVATADFPEPTFKGQKLYVKGISHETGEEELFEIANVIVEFEAEWTVTEVPLTHGEFDSSYYATGTAPIGDADAVQLVVRETPEGQFDVMGRLDIADVTQSRILGRHLRPED